MDEVTKRIVVLFLVFDIEDVGVGIGVVTLTIFLRASCKHHRIRLFLPFLLMQRLDLLFLVIQIILVLDLHFHCVVVVDSLGVLLIVHEAHLASVASLLPPEGNLQLV